MRRNFSRQHDAPKTIRTRPPRHQCFKQGQYASDGHKIVNTRAADREQLSGEDSISDLLAVPHVPTVYITDEPITPVPSHNIFTRQRDQAVSRSTVRLLQGPFASNQAVK